ncbi:MAG: hypothetical protein RL272_91 [Candidatus Parcubacteria bacterium]|jgi:hypothetical protein
MKTTPQNDAATGTKNDSKDATDLPKVIVAPELLAEGAAASDPKVEKAEGTQLPAAEGATTDAAAGAAGDTVADTGSGIRDTVVDQQPPAAQTQTASADNGADAGKGDEEDDLPVNDGRVLKYGLMAAAILGVIALFGVAFVVARNSVGTPASATAPASAPATAAGPLPLPEVRTPAPRLIDATGCRRGQYRVEGNQLVFTNCATLELAEPPAR